MSKREERKHEELVEVATSILNVARHATSAHRQVVMDTERERELHDRLCDQLDQALDTAASRLEELK